MEHHGRELPNFTASSYGVANMVAPWNPVGAAQAWPYKSSQPEAEDLMQQFIQRQAQQKAAQAVAQPQPKEVIQMNKKRLVRVLMVDNHKDVPPELSLLHDSKEVFTDKTDQELFFDMPVAQLLKDHNEKRTKIVNKDVKDRTEYLEPARISNLNMVVVTIAQF